MQGPGQVPVGVDCPESNSFSCGRPAAGSAEKASEIRVPSRNKLSGSLTGGKRSRSPESNKAARARAVKEWQTAMENRIETTAPMVRQMEAR